MKRLATALAFLACLAAVARGDAPIPAGLIVKPVDPFVAVLDNGAWQSEISLANDNPQSRAEALAWAIDVVSPGQTIRLDYGTYDFGARALRLPNNIAIVGRGKGKTTIVSTQEDQRHSCGVEIAGRGISLASLTIEWKSRDNLTRGGQALGIADPNNPGNTSIVCRDLEVVSYGSCALYYWGGGKQHRGKFVDCDFKAGRWAGCNGAGSGDDSAILEFNRCTFTADFTVYGGAGGDMGTPPNTSGFVLRGGQATFTDCVANVTGFPGTGKPNDPNGPPFKLAIGFACSSLGDPKLPTYTYKWPYLNLVRCTANVKANGAEKAIDVWGHIGTTTAKDCKGSGEGGALITEGNVEVPK